MIYLCSPLGKERLFGLVVQLVRMPACHAGGREFESRPDRRNKEKVVGNVNLFFVASPDVSGGKAGS